MRSYLKYIGVLGHNNQIHHVEFTQGVNVITGRSSTGKSAMIEIFDYCFGNSEFTIPSGIITDNAELYFIILSIKDTFVVIGRHPLKTKKIFFKEETNLPNIEAFNLGYFEEQFLITKKDFNVTLGHYFGLNIQDVDEDLDDRNYRYNNAKKGRPSIRNITPFMLQHQNLIANKHAIFYRFDEKEKREQTIEQFKIFAGFVTQEYFITRQALAEEKRTLKRLESQKKTVEEKKVQNSNKLDSLLNEYFAITGNKLLEDKAELITINPANYLNKINKIQVKINEKSHEAEKQIQALKERKNTHLAKRRELTLKLININSSIDYANSYKKNLNNLIEIDEAHIYLSQCPFCQNTNEHISSEANALNDAIQWLNLELNKTPYLLDSFESDKKAFELQIKPLEYEVKKINSEIKKLEKITNELSVNRGLNEQGLRAKLKIENLLENLVGENLSNLDEKILNSGNEITRLEGILKDKFNVDAKIRKAQNYINKAMKNIGANFEFEESYKPINLRFSLDTFELWHQKSQNDKIYLRSMGSGANWLYSHLTLFMALHRYFCSLGSISLIPPILFLDQPSQVYFPTSIKDNEDKFDAQALKDKEGESDKTDEDIQAVTNLFNQLVAFCSETLKQTEIEPQIIITDHADNLKLDTVNFETLVNGRRWRKRGFIDV